jgi:translation initiation factor 2 beta subunit (eIF-2beta)/eIF-5
MLTIENLDEVIKSWKDYILKDELGDYKLNIDEDVPKELAAITLFLDLSTVKASGETKEHYEGYAHAAQDLLRFMGIELYQDDSSKTIYLKRSFAYKEIQETLKEFLWGED